MQIFKYTITFFRVINLPPPPPLPANTLSTLFNTHRTNNDC